MGTRRDRSRAGVRHGGFLLLTRLRLTSSNVAFSRTITIGPGASCRSAHFADRSRAGCTRRYPPPMMWIARAEPILSARAQSFLYGISPKMGPWSWPK
jgi:hypothetical protein